MILVSATKLGKRFLGENNKGKDMNSLLCEKGYQQKRFGKRGYEPLPKGMPFCKKMEPGRLYWNTDIIPVLTKETQ